LANPSAAFQTQVNNTGAATANPAIIGRRPRVQYVYGGFKTAQAEFAGDYEFSWGKIKPLVGFYWDSNYGYNSIRLNTGSAASPYYQTWDVDPASPTFYINQSPTPIQPSQYTSFTPDTLSYASDQALYGLLNLSFLDDRLYVIAGARYNQSQSITTNFLGTTPAAIYPQGFRAHYTTPQAGVGYKVTKDSMLYASYSTSYTFGGGFLQSPQLVNGVETAVINGQQAPVTSEGEEVGFKTDFLNDRVSSTLSVYRIVQSDGIQSFNTIYSTGTLATTFQGVVVKSQGIEYEVTWTPIDNLQIFASVAEDDIRYTSEPLGDLLYLGVHPPFTAKTLGNIWGRYTVDHGPLKGLWVGGGMNYVGSTNGNAVNPYLFYPSYELYNSAVGYDWTVNKFKMSLAVNWQNMANKFYQPADQEVGLPSRVTGTFTLHF
jgi:iron complex outermembrane receptor protein